MSESAKDRGARGASSPSRPAGGVRGASSPSRPISAPALLAPEFLSQLERLALVARRPVRGWAAGDRRSRRAGQSVEFIDYRPYNAGDDLRYVDWNVYGRTDRLFLKLFVDDEDMCLHLLVDASASMAWGTPSKLGWAAQLAILVDWRRGSSSTAALPSRG